MFNRNYCNNRYYTDYKEPYIFTLQYTCDEKLEKQRVDNEAKCNEHLKDQISKQKTFYEEKLKKSEEQNQKSIEKHMATITSCEVQRKEYEKHIEERELELKKLKEELDMVKLQNINYADEIRNLNESNTGRLNEIRSLNESKLAYCNSGNINYQPIVGSNLDSRPSLGAKVSMKTEETAAIPAVTKRLKIS